jgi:hypothetical protein
MFRRLRLRLMLINLVIIAALFILLTSGTYLFSSIEMQNRSRMLVHRISSEIICGLISDFPPRNLPPPNDLPPLRNLPGPGDLLPPNNLPPVPLVFFIKVAPSGAATFISTSSPLTASEPFQPIAHAKGVAIDMLLDPTNYCGDEAKTKQIVCILLDNALRYTSSGSITVRLHQLQHNAILDIIDTGCGITPEHLEKIFDRFYQVNPSRAKIEGGAGLGLAIAKCLVECQRGRIEAMSIPGQGSTFSIYLPLEIKSYHSSSASTQS